MQTVLPTREYQIIFEHRPTHLYVYVESETNSLSMARNYWTQIVSILHRRKYSKVLLEKSLGKPLRAHELFTLVSQIARNGLSECSIAVFDHNYEHERCSFEQLVGTNRGLNLRIAPTLHEAEKWLLSQYDYADVRIIPKTHELIAPVWAS